MSETILRHLESRSAIRERMVALTGREPNASQTDFASACLLHGRLFWEAANASPLETKPLLLYYGAAAYAKALVMTSRGLRPEDLSQSHGLSCKVGDGGVIGKFVVKANGHGLFQEFNDVVAPLSRLHYFQEAKPCYFSTPAASSDQLSAFEASLVECLSRIPSIEEAFRLCTGAEAQVQHFSFSDSSYIGATRYSIRVDLPGGFAGEAEIAEKLAALRARCPFLAEWRLFSVAEAWGNIVLQFENLHPDAHELARALTAGAHGGQQAPQAAESFDAFQSLPPLAGGWSGASTAYIAPMSGYHVSEFSLALAALLGLSSLVRYHPHTWTACVHRRPLAGRTIDDSLLPLVGEFLSTVQAKFPAFIASAIGGGT